MHRVYKLVLITLLLPFNALPLAVLLDLAIPAMAVQHKPSGTQTATESQQNKKQSNLPAAPVTNNQATSYYEQPREDKAQGWHKFIAWPEGITAWLVVLTLGAIVWQAWETRKAAEVARDSVRLQEIVYYQWTESVNWKTSIISGEDPPKLTIEFDILNPTNVPLTLKGAYISFASQQPHTGFVIPGRFLPPKTPTHINGSIEIGDVRRSKFMDNSLGILVDGHITFESVLKKVVSQTWSGILTCGPDQTTFQYSGPMHRTETKDKEANKGNS